MIALRLQVLAIDFAALEKSLSLLPAHELLGIEEDLLPIQGSLMQFYPQLPSQEKQQMDVSQTASKGVAGGEAEPPFPEEAKAKSGKDGSFELFSKSPKPESRSHPSRSSAARMAKPESNRAMAEASSPGGNDAAETGAAEKAFEELMLSASSEADQIVQTAKSKPKLAIAPKKEGLPEEDDVNKREGLSRPIEASSANVEDLESWLDSL